MNNIKGAIDITEKWTKVSKQGFVKEMKYYKHNGGKYPVDEHHVVLKPSLEEREVANVLASKYGKTVLLVPRVNVPENMQTPDYLIDGDSFDLKSISSNSSNALFDRIKSKNRQSTNFIFNLSNSTLNEEEVSYQLNYIYRNKRCRFVNTIIIYKNNQIIRVYKRKQGNPRQGHESINDAIDQ